MPSFGKKSVYVDTNEFVYARASESFPKKHRHLPYYKEGRECIRVLQICQKNDFVVLSSMISRIELHALHLDWAKKKRLVDLSLPLGFAFGEVHRNEDAEFVRSLFTPTESTSIYKELNEWFKAWKFNSLIRWIPAGEIPFWGELTEVALRYMPRGYLADALHLGAAIGLQCTKIFTNDRLLRSAIQNMRGDRQLRRELESASFIDKGYGMPDAIVDSKGLLS